MRAGSDTWRSLSHVVRPTYHGLIDGVGGLVWEDAGGEAGDDLLDPQLVRRMQHMVIHLEILSLGTKKQDQYWGGGALQTAQSSVQKYSPPRPHRVRRALVSGPYDNSSAATSRDGRDGAYKCYLGASPVTGRKRNHLQCKAWKCIRNSHTPVTFRAAFTVWAATGSPVWSVSVDHAWLRCILGEVVVTRCP